MSDTVVHVVRHGEVDNPKKILYGRLPGYRLSELGVQMAKAAAEWLAGRDVTYLVVSPLESMFFALTGGQAHPEPRSDDELAREALAGR